MFSLKLWKKDPGSPRVSLDDSNRTVKHAIYTPLHQGEFRLVVIHPSKFGKISCSLQVCKLDEQEQQYETLSYRWGDRDTDLRSILLGGEEYKVTQNLHQALQHLRDKTSSRKVWIDALAIDQNDPREVASQIPLMARIYGNAMQTIAWLGDIKETHLLAMIRYSAYKNITEVASSIVEYSVGTKSMKKKNVRLQWLEFMRYEYWNRVWIVQEILLSKNIVLQYGKRSVGLDAVRNYGLAVNGLLQPGYWRENDTKLRFFDRFLDKSDFTFNPNDNLGWFLQPSVHETRQALSYRAWALQLCPNTHCSDPKDKVYGFYGCFPGNVRNDLAVNRERDLPEIFEEITTIFCARTHDLLCINLVEAFGQAGQSGTGIPSWIPDYGRSNLTAVQRFKHCHVLYPQRAGSVHVSFSRNREGISLLCAEAVPLANDFKQSEPLILTASGTDLIPIMISRYHRAKKELVRPGEQIRTFILAFMGNQWSSGDKVLWSTENIDVFETIMNKFGVMDTKQITHKLTKSDRATLERLVRRSYLINHLDRRMFRFTPQIPMRELNGAIRAYGFGIGPPSMHPEDKIFLIAGCDLPVVLRQVGGEHTVVGNAYLPDFRAERITEATLSYLQTEALAQSIQIC